MANNTPVPHKLLSSAMAEPSQNFILHIDGADLQSWTATRFHKTPNPYINVSLSGRVLWRSRQGERRTSLKWNESPVIIEQSSSAQQLLIAAMDQRTMVEDDCIGSIAVDLNTLYERSQGAPVNLTLMRTKATGRSEHSSTVTVRLQKDNALGTSKLAIEAAALDTNQVRGLPDIVGKTSQLIEDNSAFLSALEDIVSKLSVLEGILDEIAAVHPWVNIAWQTVSSLYKAVRNQFARDGQLVSLVMTMKHVYSFVDDVQGLKGKQKTLEDVIQQILSQTVECAIFIREYMGCGFAGRVLRQTLTSTTAEKLTSMTNRFEELKRCLDSGVSRYTALVSSQTLEGVTNLEHIETLKRLNSSDMNATSRSGCLPGTRKQILQELTEWLMTPSPEQNIMWLYGVAGSGKSTIATTVASYFNELGRLGAFLYFDRNDSAGSEPAGFVRRLAQKLALFCPDFKSAITSAIDQDTGVMSKPSASQLQDFIVKPLASVTTLPEQGPIVIVLDALDECGTAESRKEHSVLVLIAREMMKLPSVFRVLVTSRPEFDIQGDFVNKSNICRRELEVGTSSDAEDLKSYYIHQLASVSDNDLYDLPHDWPGADIIQSLVTRSAGLFIWASTAVKFLEQGFHPQEQLDILLQADSYDEAQAALYEMYRIALHHAGAWEIDRTKNAFCNVLGTVISARLPISDVVLDQLLDLKGPQASSLILSRLRCVLQWSKGQPIRTLHASFADYLIQCQGQPWYVESSLYHDKLARASLRIMTRLRFNFCDLKTSYKKNSDVEDMQSRIQNNLSPELSYACQFWVDHLVQVDCSPNVCVLVDRFLHERLLYWLEALSFLKNVALGITSMIQLLSWLHTSSDEDLKVFVRDAREFITTFQTPISDSAPHIYISAIPFSPTESVVARHFRTQFSHTLAVKSGSVKSWPIGQVLLEGHTEPVRCAAFSPCGRYVVSCSFDQTVRIWNVETSLAIIELPEVNRIASSVAYSPDGSYVVCGFDDGTISIWRAESSDVVHKLQGHTRSILSIVFSFDGVRIVSNSLDGTVYVWDVETGAKLASTSRISESAKADYRPPNVAPALCSPMDYSVLWGDDSIHIWNSETGHIRHFGSELSGWQVQSLAWSQDGKFIAAGTDNYSIYIWDVERSQLAFRPLTVKSDEVSCIAFSPSSRYMASCFDDCTIGVWDLENSGVQLMEGHRGSITSIQFSSNGEHIVSASHDHTVRIWTVNASQEYRTSSIEDRIGPQITRVAFSPDRRSVAYSATDCTVNVWHVETGKIAAGPWRGHSKSISSVSFSPSSALIVSGSLDCTVRVWKMENGDAGPSINLFEPIVLAEFVAGESRIAVVCRFGFVFLWNIETSDMDVVALKGVTEQRVYEDYFDGVSFSRDRSWIVGCLGKNTSICVWSVETGEIFASLVDVGNMIRTPIFSPRGSQAAGLDLKSRNVILLWGIGKGEMTTTLLSCHDRSISAEDMLHLAYPVHGEVLASGTARSILHVWNVETGEVIQGPLDCAADSDFGSLRAITFSPNGQELLSCTISRHSQIQVRVWQLQENTNRVMDTTRWLTVNDDQLGLHKHKTGWIIAKNGELICWIPPYYRQIGVPLGLNVATFPVDSAPMLISNDFNHGLEWTQCRA